MPETLTYQSETTRSSFGKSDLLNRFFASCFSPSSPLQNNHSADCATGPSFSTITCSEEDVFHLLSTCKAKTASGPDGISSAMLRGTARSIAPTLTTLFNCSLSQGVVPEDWKISNITPIPKSGDPSLASNYRPISLLSLVSKVLERLIHSKLLNYILSNDLLSNCQHGFRPGSSTQEALLLATNDWHNLLSFNKQVAVVFFDIHKAFDSVPHHLLINSLMDFGVSGPLLTWLKSYLSNRRQRVVLDGESSALLPVTSGVPQGSILGPLLFIIYMNSISQVPLSPGTKLLLYADDIVMYRPVNSQSDVSSLQNDVNSIHRWTVEHGLTLNTSKSHLMPITRSRNPLQTHLTVDSIPLETVYSTKYLGVNISSDLTWGQHISITCKKAKQHLGLLHRKFHQASPQVRSKLYSSVILPKLEYCSSVWDPHQVKYISMLESVQKFGCRVISKEWNSDYPTLLTYLQLPTLQSRRKQQRLIMCYKILTNNSSIPSSHFTPHPSPSPRLHHNKALFIPLVKTTSFKCSFFVDVIPLWNSLPSNFVSSSSISSFKRLIRSHFSTSFW